MGDGASKVLWDRERKSKDNSGAACAVFNSIL